MSKPKTRFESILGVAALAIICLISLANVLVRYATDASFAFTEEFSVFLMVILTFAGGSIAARHNEHIRISFLEHKLNRTGRCVLYTLQWLGTLIVLGLIIWYGGLLTYEELIWESLSAGLGLPNWLYLIWLPLLSLVLGLRVTQNWLDRLREERKEATQ